MSYLHMGTGNLTVPMAIPPDRNRLQPDLLLVYSSGRRNGTFGPGWALSVQGVTRDRSAAFRRSVFESNSKT
jgi:hypothetical protein